MLSKKKYVCLILMQTSCDCRHTPPHMHKISERCYITLILHYINVIQMCSVHDLRYYVKTTFFGIQMLVQALP